VVIAIIGIISTIGVSSYINYLKVARDAKRKADIDLLLKTVINFQTVNGRAPIESYCQDTSAGSDPVCGTFVPLPSWDPNSGIVTELVGGGWVPGGLPVDPINNSSLGYYYYYEPHNTGFAFPSGVVCNVAHACGGFLQARLETGGYYTVYWKGYLE